MNLKDQFQQAHMSAEDIALIRWKNDNPSGFERALDETITGHFEVLNAQRYDQGRALLGEQEKLDIIDELPENPDKIQQRIGEVAQGLSPEAIEWRDAMADITNNLDLAGQLLLYEEEFQDSDITGLLTASQTIADTYGMTLSEVVNGLGIEVSDNLMQEIQTMEQPESATEMKAEAVLSPLPGPGQ